MPNKNLPIGVQIAPYTAFTDTTKFEMATDSLSSTTTKPISNDFNTLFSRSALDFLAGLHRRFEPRRQELLKLRVEKQEQINDRKYPDFLKETKWIRDSDQVVADIPADLLDRRVEITGPPDRKLIINALNCGAKVFMADFEDSHSPTQQNCVEGQLNLIAAVRRTLDFVDPKTRKYYKLNKNPAVLFVRPRGLHLDELHMRVDNQPISGSLFDFGLYFFHNAQWLMSHNTGPYFYIPKLESHLEARFQNDVFSQSQEQLKISIGTIRATVLIETILAAFEMDEILYELRQHSAGLNCGRQDYMFSIIKKFHNDPDFVMPDRQQVGMDCSFMSAYVKLLVRTCHRRGIHAMGGMAAQIPIRNNPEANRRAVEKVRRDKLAEVKAGHDGTQVAHPGLVKVAFEVFDEYMPSHNQIFNKHPEICVRASDLLTLNFDDSSVKDSTKGSLSIRPPSITYFGLIDNIRSTLLYLESQLRGVGCVPINNLMEDAATAEIARVQLWQWVHHQSRLSDSTLISLDFMKNLIRQTSDKLQEEFRIKGHSTRKLKLALNLLNQTLISKDFVEFLPSIAYPFIVSDTVLSEGSSKEVNSIVNTRSRF